MPVDYRPALVALVVEIIGCISLYATLGQDVSQWSVRARILLAILVTAPMFVFGWTFTQASKRAEAEHIAEAKKISPRDFQPPAPYSRGQTHLWVLGGILPGAVLAFFLTGDTSIPSAIRFPILFILPMAGALIGYRLSPEHRAEKEFDERVDAIHAQHRALQQETEEERYQRERVTADRQKTQREWRQRVYDAMIWWSSQGEKLTQPKESGYLEAIVRQHPLNVHRYDTILANYKNADDPCSNSTRARQVATWAVEHLPEEIAKHTKETDRDVAGVTKILIHHHEREMVLHKEATALALKDAVNRLKEEKPEELVKRVLRDYDSVVLARAVGMEQIQDMAKDPRYTDHPTRRDEDVRQATAAVEAMLELWMLKKRQLQE